MRSFVLGFLAAAGIAVVVTLLWGRPTTQVPALPPVAESSVAPIIPPTPSPSTVATAGCDETEELMARMFVGLTEAALTGSGKTREDLAAAVAADREIWRRYLEVLDIPVDEAWLDAAISPNLDQRLLSPCLEP